MAVNFDDDMLVETDDGERMSVWSEHHGNFAVLKDRLGSLMWKYGLEHPRLRWADVQENEVAQSSSP